MARRANPPPGSIGERISRLMGNQTCRQLGERLRKEGLDVTQQSISQWCAGGGIAPENVVVLAKVFNVSPGYLQFGSDAGTDDGLPSDARLIARAWLAVPEKLRGPLTEELLRVALALVSDDDPQLRADLERAVAALR